MENVEEKNVQEVRKKNQTYFFSKLLTWPTSLKVTLSEKLFHFCLESNAWNLKEVPSWPPKMKILEVTLENCKKSPLKHFTETPIFV